MKKYDKGTNGIIADFENTDKAVLDKSKKWTINFDKAKKLEREIEKYQWLVDILSTKQTDFPYNLVQILQNPEDINEFIYPEIKNWSKGLLRVISSVKK